MASGVSDYGGGDSSTDMATIMDGGANWMARMTAFLEAKERAQAEVDKAGIVGDIVAKRDEARNDREIAAKELADARAFADGIVEKANEQADEIIRKARAQAGSIISAAQAKAEEVSAQAQAISDAASKALREAQVAAEQSKAREAGLDQMMADANRKTDEANAAIARAAKMEEHYRSFAERLSLASKSLEVIFAEERAANK